MRTIKFRGKSLCGFKTFGDLVHAGLYYHPYIPEFSPGFEVDPNSIEQLVGYDANGKEIYEGDVLIDERGQEHIARLESVVQQSDTAECSFLSYPTRLKLKEANHEDD